MPAVKASTDMSRLKDGGVRCLSAFCVNCTCLMCTPPFIAGNAKLCCCQLQLQSKCPCITFEGASCCDKEQGCVEVIAKLCCVYVEAQLPPSNHDIGCACCGAQCCGGVKAREATYEPLIDSPAQQVM
mmetsp:Transcript_96273/g.167189  ORF Transcript_96273/g.167189 Transcript_96273/m.167189 type:complete len:128 (+) Transcript_96273:94-477(+)